MVFRITNIDSSEVNYYLTPRITVGSEIVARGKVTSAKPNFWFDLQDTKEGSNIMLHNNVRSDPQKVVLNTWQGGKWQTDERENHPVSFTKGSEFTIRISVGPEAYRIFINGKFFVDYKHRLPYHNIRYVSLSQLTRGAEWDELVIYKRCRVPYKVEIPEGLTIGKAVRIRGAVNDDATRFLINFNNDLKGDTAGLQFNPRQTEKNVVLSSKVGSWQEQVKGQEWFPFDKGEFFDLLFVVLDGSLNVYVKQKFFTSHKFSAPLKDIRYLHIDGDIALMDVAFEDPLPKDYVKPIPSGLQAGDVIVTRGFFYETGNQFSINLIEGTDPSDDLALQFNPRRNPGKLILSNKEYQKIGQYEEHQLPSGLSTALPFVVAIVNAGTEFKIYTNGNQQISVKAISESKDVKGIHTTGDAYIHEITLLRRTKDFYVEKLPGALEPGCWVCDSAIPKKETVRFSLNLQCGDSLYGTKSSDIAFHFNPRLNDDVAVRCTLRNGEWDDTDEKDVPKFFPFKVDEISQVKILTLKDIFKVFVNGRFYIDYKHRIDIGRITHFSLENDQCNVFQPEHY